jgi:hypothetical protein
LLSWAATPNSCHNNPLPTTDRDDSNTLANTKWIEADIVPVETDESPHESTMKQSKKERRKERKTTFRKKRKKEERKNKLQQQFEKHVPN